LRHRDPPALGVAVGTRKGARTAPWPTLLETAFPAHETFLEDAPRIRRLHTPRYEDFAAEPVRSLAAVAAFLGLDGEVPAGAVQAQHSAGHARTWRQCQTSANPLPRARHRALRPRFAGRAAAVGYDTDAAERRAPPA